MKTSSPKWIHMAKTKECRWWIVLNGLAPDNIYFFEMKLYFPLESCSVFFSVGYWSIWMDGEGWKINDVGSLFFKMKVFCLKNFMYWMYIGRETMMMLMAFKRQVICRYFHNLHKFLLDPKLGNLSRTYIAFKSC